MIEFKAECGHTVRAKDDDAGGVVRCSYCGRKAPVPNNQDDDLDFLFDDIQGSAAPADAVRPRRKIWAARARTKRQRGRGGLDVFALIFRMCYAAVLLIIVVFVGRKYVLPLFTEGGLSKQLARPTQRPGRRVAPEARQRSGRTQGLINQYSPKGLYVGSTPPGALVYCAEQSKLPAGGRVQDVPDCTQVRANGPFLRLADGVYVVDVVLPWNDPALNDPALHYYQQYRALRRSLERASSEERNQLVADFFVPDEADSVFVDRTQEQIYLVRRYGDVTVRNGRSPGVRALFLPRIRLPGREGFSIGKLVTDYMPKQKAFAFDEQHVRNELDFYDVPETDRLYVVKALSRIGVVPYMTPDGRSRLFKIGVHDGQIVAPEIRAPEP